MISFFTWRLNFYRFKWWRKLHGIPEPRPLSFIDSQLILHTASAMLDFSASVNKDYEHQWAPGQKITVKRPTRYKPPHKDRYL